MDNPQLNIACNCGESLLKSHGAESKVRGRIVILRDNTLFTVCKSCAKEVSLPFTVTYTTKNIPLILKK